MKNLLTDKKINALVDRIGNLTPVATPVWGKLTVNGMLRHCIIVTDAIISSKETRRPKFRERLLMPVFYILKQLPRNFQSGPKYLASDIDCLQFETERRNFISLLNSLRDHNKKLMGVHPFFGPLDTNRWRKFLLLHTDHHLRQFNV